MLTCLLVWLSSRVLPLFPVCPTVLDATLTGCGMGPDSRLLRLRGGAAETDFNGALSVAETALTDAVCAAETDFHGMIPRSRSLSHLPWTISLALTSASYA